MRLFPIGDNLMAQLFLVQADLSENQRERLISSMTKSSNCSVPPERAWRGLVYALADRVKGDTGTTALAEDGPSQSPTKGIMMVNSANGSKTRTPLKKAS